MSRRRLAALIRKEWLELRTNRTIIGTFVLLAAVFLVLPLGLAFGAVGPLSADLEREPAFMATVEAMVAAEPGLAAIPMRARLQVVLLQQFVPLFLVLPITGAMFVATYSVVGEKTSRSLEAVLATPVTAGELVLGKSLAAAIPAVAGSWGVFVLFAAGVWALGGTAVAALTLSGAVLLLILLLTPLLAILALGLGVLVSSRSSDPRSAQQIAGVLILPVVGLMAAQLAGAVMLGPGFVLVLSAIVAIGDVVVMRFGVRLFDRDRILSRWR